jgi:hypothetical protein
MTSLPSKMPAAEPVVARALALGILLCQNVSCPRLRVVAKSRSRADNSGLFRPSRSDAMTTACLSIDGRDFAFPVVTGSEAERGIDISTLRSQTGVITLDSGYGNTGACESAITFIDGEKGILRYRGYSIEQLAEHAQFSEVAYLLIHGDLPNRQEFSDFRDRLTYHSLLHEDMKKF